MLFIDRKDELARLDRLTVSQAGGLAVVYGRRRIGKTRLLLEWSSQQGGLYSVADQSAAEIQRRYLAEAVATRLPGFADVEYRDWRALFERLAREARRERWRGPIILDELPYLVLASPELPSVLQRWIDHEAREADLIVAIAGSSQRMMQGFVLSSDSPLFGRAQEILDLRPIDPIFIPEAFPDADAVKAIEIFTAWGGVPRYWELASELDGDVSDQIDQLVLDPLAPLHREPDRLLLEEIPSALETRPILDAIGSGAHRLSEIAGRLGRPATSMTRPLDRLKEMGLVRRETPFGEPAKKSRRTLYKIDDPFVRLWFRVVAPHRAQLAMIPASSRRRLLEKFWPGLISPAWEDLCRLRLPHLESGSIGALGPWGPASRWWHGNQPEWDLISESIDGERLLLGEVKWSREPFGRRKIEQLLRDLAQKSAPRLPRKYDRHQQVRALFVPRIDEASAKTDGVDGVVDAGALLSWIES